MATLTSIAVPRPAPRQSFFWQDFRRIALPICLTSVLAVGLGLSISWAPFLLAALVGVTCLALILKSPMALTAMFGLAGFFSAWFYEAAQEGIFQSPSILTSIKTWSLLVMVGLVVTGGPIRVNRPIALAVLIYAASIALSVPLAAAHAGSSGPLFSGFDGVLLALSPLAVMILMARTGSRRAGAQILLTIIAIECLYSVIQFTQLTWEEIPTTWTTVGNDIRWWDWKAVWGSFATTGKNAFGGAIALSGCVALAWFTSAGLSPTRRIVCGVIFLLCAALCVMSESRSGVLSLAAATVVIGVSKRGGLFLVPAVVLGVIVIASLPATSSALDVLQSRGFQDDDAKARQHVWDALLADRNPISLITGDGYATITSTTAKLNIPGLAYSASLAAAPPPSENLYIRRLVEGGLLGLFALIAFFGLLLKESYSKSANAISQTWRLTLRGTVVALIIQSFFADTLMFPQWAAIFALIVGVAGGALAIDERPLFGKREPR